MIDKNEIIIVDERFLKGRVYAIRGASSKDAGKRNEMVITIE